MSYRNPHGGYSTPKPKRIEPGLYLMKILYTHVEKNLSGREFGIVEMEVVSSGQPDTQPGERRMYAVALDRQGFKGSSWEEDWKFLSAEATRDRKVYVLATKFPTKSGFEYTKCVFSTVPITTHEDSDAYRYKEIVAGMEALRKEGLTEELIGRAALAPIEASIAVVKQKIWDRLGEPTRTEITKWVEARKKLP